MRTHRRRDDQPMDETARLAGRLLDALPPSGDLDAFEDEAQRAGLDAAAAALARADQWWRFEHGEDEPAAVGTVVTEWLAVGAQVPAVRASVRRVLADLIWRIVLDAPDVPSRLRFRNVDAHPSDPVESWPQEGMLAAIERGHLPDWRRIAEALLSDPWGEVAASLKQAIETAEDDGGPAVLAIVLERARRSAGSSGFGAGTARRPSEALSANRAEILELVRRHKATNARVFGSVARGEDHPGSDLDLLVKFDSGASLLDQAALQEDLQDLLGVRVDVVSEAGVGPDRLQILDEAGPI